MARRIDGAASRQDVEQEAAKMELRFNEVLRALKGSASRMSKLERVGHRSVYDAHNDSLL